MLHKNGQTVLYHTYKWFYLRWPFLLELGGNIINVNSYFVLSVFKLKFWGVI